jgi:hypothetical protein
MGVNDYAFLLAKRGAIESIASKLAPTGGHCRPLNPAHKKGLPKEASFFVTPRAAALPDQQL